MANNCLVKKLKGVVNDPNLIKFDEVRIYQKSSPIKQFNIGYDVDAGTITCRAIGAVFSNHETTLVSNDRIVQVSFDSADGNAIIIANKKQKIVSLRSAMGSCEIKGTDLKYLPDLGQLEFMVRGGIADLIPSLDAWLTTVRIANSAISGDISALASYVGNVVDMNIENTNITGDATTLLNNMVSCTSNSFGCAGSNVSIDPSLINHDAIQALYVDNKNEIRWTQTRSSARKIIAMQNAYMSDYIDSMLINQADCQIGDHTDKSFFMTISVYGTRTSASDSAVATLKSKGYTVKVNGETL